MHPEATQHGRVAEHARISECVIWGSRADDILPLYGIPPAQAFDPTADSRGLRLPRNDTISAKVAWAWLMKNVDMDPELAVQPPPTAPAASRGVYVNWILYDAKEFRWHQWWCARVPVLCRIARPLFRVLQSPCERARATPSAESRGHSRAPPG